MTQQSDVPVLTAAECREMLNDAQTRGPVRFPWEIVALVCAVTLTAAGLYLIAMNGLAAGAAAVAFLGFAMLLFQLLLHECAHAALFSRPIWNDVVGWLLGLVVLTPYFSFRHGHAIHHSYAGTDDDPTAAPQDTCRQHVLIDFFVQLRIIPILYLGGVYGPYLLYDLRDRSRQKWMHLAGYVGSLIAILTLHASLAWHFGWGRYLPLILAAFWFSAILYELLFTQNQHVGLRPVPDAAERYRHREQVNFSRSVRLPCAGLFLYFNLHKEHHLFPQLPCRYLPRIHQWLREHRSDILAYTSDHLGVLDRRQHLNLFTPTAGDHDDRV
jgi:omega-6 fatty acid desaturase (delta-12 desaturase)